MSDRETEKTPDPEAEATAEIKLQPGDSVLVLSAHEVLLVFGVLSQTALSGNDLRVAGRLLDRLDPEAAQALQFLGAAPKV